MVSLVSYLAALALIVATIAFVVAWSARLMGSPRGKWSVSLVATVVVGVIGLAISALTFTFEKGAETPLAIEAFATIAQLALTWIVFRKAFQLSRARTWAPLAAYVVASVLSAVLMLTAFRPFVAEAFHVPTASMAPNVNAGDRIVVNKRLGAPRRWDVVAYYVPDPAPRPGRSFGSPPLGADGKPPKYCKRVVGMPGDRLRFEGDALYINDQLAKPPVTLARHYHLSEAGRNLTLYEEGEAIVLASDEYFLLGDNVDRAGDARYHGPVKRASIIGIVDLCYWPPGRVRTMR